MFWWNQASFFPRELAVAGWTNWHVCFRVILVVTLSLVAPVITSSVCTCENNYWFDHLFILVRWSSSILRSKSFFGCIIWLPYFMGIISKWNPTFFSHCESSLSLIMWFIFYSTPFLSTKIYQFITLKFASYIPQRRIHFCFTVFPFIS